ncbi:MAG: MbnP family protein, partial [Limisphaerales bacterium]
SVTRLDFLVSNFGLRREGGTWLVLSNEFGYISGREQRVEFTLRDVPEGDYDAMRFQIGLEPAINHQNPAKYPAGHPLNPDVDGLHWGWMGGYVFLALEGRWLESLSNPAQEANGYSFHLATDPQLMTINLPATFGVSNDVALVAEFDVARLFNGPGSLRLSRTTNSTHSRTNDAVATLLHREIETAFRVLSISPMENSSGIAAAQLTRVEIGPHTTLHPFRFSGLFPQPALPRDNPLTEEGIALGRRLFFDARLSRNNQQACASCHDPSHGFSQNRPVSVGAEGQPGTRNAMGLFNLAWKTRFFWDGRAATLRQQVLQPIQNPLEMNQSLTNVVAKLSDASQPHSGDSGHENYPELFNRAFGSRQITADRIARALEQFLLAQVSDSSKFDLVLAGEAKFSVAEQRGFELFNTEYDPPRGFHGADCFHCHGGPLFQSQSFANNGLESNPTDPGRFAATGREADRGKFAVPSLRNVELTAPYMHDGRFQTLEQVIEHYSSGVKPSATLDPNLAKHPQGGLNLSQSDKQALVAFLKTLTDERFVRPRVLVAGARRE